MSNRGSATWLIIFLCLIIVGLVVLVSNAWHQQAVNSLNEQINNLQQQVEQTDKLRSRDVKILEELLAQQQATCAAKPSPSSNLKTATISGEKR